MVAPCADFDTRSLLEYPTRIAGVEVLMGAFDQGRADFRRGARLALCPLTRHAGRAALSLAIVASWRRGWGYEARRTMRARSRTTGA